jgi:hypothetical protein
MNQKMISVSDYLGLYEADSEELTYLLSTEFKDQERYRDFKKPYCFNIVDFFPPDFKSRFTR